MGEGQGTRSNVTLVHPDLVERLGGVFLQTKRLVTPAGDRMVPCFRIEGVHLGPRAVGFLNVLALPAAPLGGRKIDGILGQDFFEAIQLRSRLQGPIASPPADLGDACLSPPLMRA